MKKPPKNKLEQELSDGVRTIMEMFYEFNPALNFANKTSREAAEWMIKRWGVEKVKEMTTKVLSCQGQDYAPVATNPYEMKTKLLKFKMYFERNNKPKAQIYEG